MNMNYEQAVEYIHGMGMFGSKPGLERINALLERIDHPEKELKIIHVAGTNGKGSTSAMLSAILKENGYSVGLFISPYLESFNERIQYNGNPIVKAELAKLVSEIKPIVKEVASTEVGQPTQFEVVTAMGLLYFKRINVDFVVLEVGLGGRYDATNIVNPIVSIITSIGLDHQAILGDTLEEIAMEKAGIIKKGVPVIVGKVDKAPLDVIKTKAKLLNAEFYGLGDRFSLKIKEYSLEGQTISYRYNETANDYNILLLGEHQARNASLALTTAKVLKNIGYKIEQTKTYAGLAKARWPGRLEIVKKEPLIILDGAHNAEATSEIAKTIKALYNDPIILVLGILSGKNYQGMIKDLVPLAKHVYITAPDYYRALDSESLAIESEKYCNNVEIIEKVSEAVDKAISGADLKDLILITGSLYTVGEARSHLIENHIAK